MAKIFTYKDNLGNILSSSPEPFIKPSKEKSIEGFDDYLKLDTSDYAVYAETSPDTTPKYTMISKNRDSGVESTKKEEKPDIAETPVPAVPDVIASKLLEQSKMSPINTIYIGSLTVVGLYVLFRYLKY
jgi:hypothetical protein